MAVYLTGVTLSFLTLICTPTHCRNPQTGLSATPGNSVEQVQKVIDSLHIEKVDFRPEDDPDITRLVHPLRQGLG